MTRITTTLALVFALALTGPAHATHRVDARAFGDSYISCLASSTAVNLRVYRREHSGYYQTIAEAAATDATEKCAKLWPKHFPKKGDQDLLRRDAADVIAKITHYEEETDSERP